MNMIIIQGRLTRDPELTTSQSGTEMAKYTVAVDDRRKDEKKTNFFSCVAFGKAAAFVAKYYHKGDGIIVTGRMDSNKSQKDNHTYWNVIAENHEFPLGRTTAQAGREEPAPDTAQEPAGFTPVETEELPF